MRWPASWRRDLRLGCRDLGLVLLVLFCLACLGLGMVYG